MPQTSNPLLAARRRAGRVKRWAKRKVTERRIGKEYRSWLAQAATIAPASVNFDVTISILVPVYNPPMNFLAQCLDSVLSQQATNWQLVIVNDGSTDPAVAPFLDQFATAHLDDPRILVSSKQNGGISSALNAALELATGQYIGMLDNDDLLDPRCIAEFSRAIIEQDLPDVVYSDEDKVSPRGEHYELFCKPDFSPELLLGQMYLCHFTVFKRDQVDAIGGLRSQMDGAQDFDLALRLLPQVQRVVHLPRPLYHWRAWAGSTALTIEAKPWAQEATMRVQAEHLQRTYGGGSVTASAVAGLNQVHPRIPKGQRVSVIIPTIGTKGDDGGRLVDAAVASLRARQSQVGPLGDPDALEIEIIAVTTGQIDPIAGVDHTVVYRTDAFNFSEAINAGRAAATGQWLLLLNDDTAVAEPDPIIRMLELGQTPGVGVVGAKLTYPDGRLQHVGMILLPGGPTHCWIGKSGQETGYFGSTLSPRNYSAVTAAAMLTPTSVFDALGGFDQEYARDFNDVDYCLRAGQAGYRVAWTPYAHFTHFEGASISRRKADSHEADAFRARWGATMTVDPYYSPSLDQQIHHLYQAR